MLFFLASLCAAYLVGAVPTGFLAGRLFKGVDVRQLGSGNLGATNVYRVVGAIPGLLVLIVDVAKGWLPVMFLAPVAAFGPSVKPEGAAILLGMAAVAGHIWNPFLQFQGGKGVATGLGVLLGLSRPAALATAAVWVAVVLMTRYVSVASIAAAMAAPFLLFFLEMPVLWILGSIGISLTVIARHRSNLLRLLHGEEHRVGTPQKSREGDSR